MNADLAETLAELGPGYRAIVDRMKGAFGDADGSAVRVGTWSAAFWRRAALVAASLLLCLGGAWLLAPRRAPAAPDASARSAYVLAYSRDAATLDRLVRTQLADGSWGNDFLTRQNAAALRAASGEAPRIAYRRAVRYLRTRGLAPLSDDELRARGDFAARRLARS